MRYFSVNQQLVFNNPPVNYCVALKIFDDEVLLKAITSYFYDLTIDGVEYQSNSSLLAVDPLNVSTAVDSSEFKFQLADPDFLEGPYIESNYVGKEVEIYLVFIDPDTDEPLTNLEDVFLVYSGYGNKTEYLIDSSASGEVVLQITCSNPMADLDHKKAMYLSKDFVRGRNPLDESCDQVYSGSGRLQLKWGKS
jgi:hypothetical protein